MSRPDPGDCIGMAALVVTLVAGCWILQGLGLWGPW